MIIWAIKVKPFGYSCLVTLTPQTIIAQPEGDDTAERLRRDSANRAESETCKIIFKKEYF